MSSFLLTIPEREVGNEKDIADFLCVEVFKGPQQKGLAATRDAHPSVIKREQLQVLLGSGTNMVNIAEQLGRTPSTIEREIRRKSRAYCYKPERAQRCCDGRRRACHPKSILDHAPLLDYVKTKMCDENWTPETLAISLPVDFHDGPPCE